ncbi:MAG: Putative 2Fe-2S ferredoxin [Nitrospira sp.]|nr:Rieske 2Fe-2S domain-containing protein [Nitrospira sp.]ULA59139.1 MAG: Putative 2Fe-2S ferredoxin [Nitrospira sp.]
MEGFQCVAKVEEIPPGQVKVVKVNERAIAVFNIEGHFHAIYNSCPHEGGPLNKGRVKGHVVSCPWHDLAFDVRNGQGTDGGGYCVGSYDVRVKDGQIFVGGRRKV